MVLCLPQLPAPSPSLSAHQPHVGQVNEGQCAGPPEWRGRWVTRAGESGVQGGLGGHCRWRGSKGSCWFVTELGAFCSPARRGAMKHTHILIEDGRDLLVTSSGPVSPDPGCSRGSLCRAELCRTGTCWLRLPKEPGRPRAQGLGCLFCPMAGEVLGTVLDQSSCSPKHFPHVVQEPAHVKDVLRMFWRGFWRVQASRPQPSRVPGTLLPLGVLGLCDCSWWPGPHRPGPRPCPRHERGASQHLQGQS